MRDLTRNTLMALGLMCPLSLGADLDFLEQFSLAEDRAPVLKQLTPGTDDYYYYQCLHLQHQKQLGEVDKQLELWANRCGRTPRYEEIANRQALLIYGQDAARTLSFLQQKLRPRLDHQQIVPGQKPGHPTTFDPALLAPDTLRKRALAGHPNLDGFEDSGLEQVANENLDLQQRRALLRRIQWPDYPNLVNLVAAELQAPDAGGFGSLPAHQRLLLPQLEQLLELRPQLLGDEQFVRAYMRRLRPGPDVDWRRDPAQKTAYLQRLWSLVNRLGPPFNSLKALVLYHWLAHDRAQGIYDQERWLQYLRLPRSVFYMNRAYLERPEHVGKAADLGSDFMETTLLAPVGDDESLVRDYLLHFLAMADQYDPYAPYFDEAYLKAAFAEAKILGGQGDPERWVSLLGDPARYQAIKDRVELKFAPHNRVDYLPTDPVGLDLDLKNVKNLVVKVFEINTLNYHRERNQEINPDIDLDGLVATQETTHSYDEPPARRVRRHFDFPGLNRRGVFVVDFIGGGKSSRALIHKGHWLFLERPTSSGHLLTILDETRRKLTNATVWLAGHEYRAEKEGQIRVPYSAQPAPQPILITADGFTTRAILEHRGEQYALEAGIHVEREALLPRRKAVALVRPVLTLNEVPVALSLLEEPVLFIESTDAEGVKSTREIKDLKLGLEQELAQEFQVPEQVVELKFTLRGRVQSLTQNKKLDLTDSRSFSLNQVNATDKTEDLYLGRVSQGYLLRVLGKSGEPRPDRPVKVVCKHRDFRTPIETWLQTDVQGRIGLGKMEGIRWLQASGPENTTRTWALTEDRRTVPSVIHGRAGERLAIPYMAETTQGIAGRLLLLEERDGAYVQDFTKQIEPKEGFIEIPELAAGDYVLALKSESLTVALRITEGETDAGYLGGANRLLEHRAPPPLQIVGLKVDDQQLRIQLRNSSSLTRVHVVATRFQPAYPLFDDLVVPGSLPPRELGLPRIASAYVAERELGNEYRYILERKQARRFPGNMLDRPGLLLNPRVTRKTETASAAAALDALTRAQSVAPPVAAAMPAPQGLRREELSARAAELTTCLDFLAEPSVLLANLRPDQNGEVIVPREGLGAGQQFHVLAAEPGHTVYRQGSVPEKAWAPLDLRLGQSLDSAKHYAEQNQTTLLLPGQSLVISDLGAAKLELYDSLAKAYQLLRTLNDDARLAEFGFLLQWPKLPDAEKRATYSKYACHELSFFLLKKDPAFFEAVVAAHLRNKKDKTFLDQYLLREDLRSYLEPWAYGQLNTVERILLAQRVQGQPPTVVRDLREWLALTPPDWARQELWFRTALQGSALTDGAATDVKLFEGKTQAKFPTLGDTPAAGRAFRGAAANLMAAPMTNQAMLALGLAKARAVAPPRPAKAPAREREKLLRADDALQELAADADRREATESFYQALDKTQEWAENNYYQWPIDRHNASLVEPNAFWADYAQHTGPGPFLSAHLAEASRNFTEVLLALSVLDLPFEPGAQERAAQGPRLTLKAQSPMIAFHREIKETPLSDAAQGSVFQNFFQATDRHQFVEGERLDKFVTNEFQVNTVYGCQVLLTAPSPRPQKLNLLLQVPQGAVPLRKGFYTRSQVVELPPYATATAEFLFYFPAAGEFTVYPAQAARGDKVLANAAPRRLRVLDTPARQDTNSWEYVSQQAASEQVLAYLERENLYRVDLERMAWRLRDKKFYQDATARLTARHVYHPAIWAYSVYHNEPATLGEFLRHQDAFLNECGAYLESPLVRLDPVARRGYEHLEYSPLVNARAHLFGKRREILNRKFAEQYQAFLRVLSCRPKLDDADRLSLTYYLLLQDRVAEAQATFARVDPQRLPTRLQYDYLQTYLDFYSPDHQVARTVATRYADYPVDRWRKLFQGVLAQLDEVEGKGSAVVDAENRDQVQARRAAAAPTLDFTVEARQITLNFQNLTEGLVNYYLMDVELLFSRSPFVQQGTTQFAFVRPNRSDPLRFPATTNTLIVSLPQEFASANVMVELLAGGLRKSQPYFGNSLAVQISENYGQLKVTHAQTGLALPLVYVKVFARLRGGEVRFYKDGYTDLRGRFDYTSLNTSELDGVERFAMLVLSEKDGALVREAAPPKR